ncbi:MAG: hypothetical protein WC868_10045 [Bacteroidales bacterium]
MTNKETVERNIGLTFDFLRQMLKEPSIFDKIPDGSVIEFVEKDFAKRVTKVSVKPNRYLKVNSQFELLENKRKKAHIA